MRRVSSQFSFDPAKVDNASNQGIEGAMVGVAFGDKEPAVGQIAEAWRKPEPQQVAEPEHGERLTNCTVDGVARFRRLVAGGPSAGREFSDSIDRKISQAREHRAEVVADR